MLIHRDYFDNSQSRIKIYPDRIEMYNPGAAPKPVEDILENEVTVPRNPVMAKAFRIIGWAETAGSGMMKIFKALEQLKCPKPIIDNNARSSYFKMTFELAGVNTKVADQAPTKRPSDQVMTKQPSNDFELKKREILKFCLTPQKLKDIMNTTGHKHRATFMTNYINPLVKEELLNLTLPGTPRDPRQMYQTTDKGRKIL